MLKVLGPYALTDDPKWDRSDGHMEVFQRSSIVAMHPGGTAEIPEGHHGPPSRYRKTGEGAGRKASVGEVEFLVVNCVNGEEDGQVCPQQA